MQSDGARGDVGSCLQFSKEGLKAALAIYLYHQLLVLRTREPYEPSSNCVTYPFFLSQAEGFTKGFDPVAKWFQLSFKERCFDLAS